MFCFASLTGTVPTLLDRPHWSAALQRALIMGAGFFIIYGGLNWYTHMLAQDAGLPSYYMDWERDIPFVATMIFPYMSIDLLFVAAFFLARNHHELNALGKRIGFAILVSALMFYLWPMQFAFTRPPTDGFAGVLFGLLAADLPYNQCPSLHISLAMVLWPMFGRHERGIWRILSLAWFALIALSTVLVWQHHIIDVAGGLLVGLLALHLFPLEWSKRPRYQHAGRQHRVMALRWSALVLVFVIAAALIGGFGLLLLYPALSLALVALAYARGWSNFLQKTGGRLPLSTRILFAPWLFGICLAWKYHRRRSRSCAWVRSNLVFGRRLDRRELEQLQQEGIGAVLDLAPEVKVRFPQQHLAYCHVPILDFTTPDPQQIRQAVEFIRQHSRYTKVYVHCAMGYFRSATIVTALLCSEGMDTTQALDKLRTVRPGIIVPEQALWRIRALYPAVAA